MKNGVEKKENTNSLTTSITVSGITYKTGGNILFSEDEADHYFLAESPLLDNVDKAVEHGILENGMQAFLRKVRI